MACTAAKGIVVGRCHDPECDLVHIMLCDRNDAPIAQITPDCAEALKIIADVIECVDGIKRARN